MALHKKTGGDFFFSGNARQVVSRPKDAFINLESLKWIANYRERLNLFTLKVGEVGARGSVPSCSAKQQYVRFGAIRETLMAPRRPRLSPECSYCCFPKFAATRWAVGIAPSSWNNAAVMRGGYSSCPAEVNLSMGSFYLRISGLHCLLTANVAEL